jgi:NADPH-dependent 7-cyano-7-deazaguanine reductase QueF
MTNSPMLGRHVPPDEYGRLDVFPVDRPTIIRLSSNELQALCPAVDGLQPDIYEATISYTATTAAIESKSLKLLLTTYRDQRIFAEHLAADLADRINAASDGITDVEVTLTQNVRGGIVTSVTTHPGT